MNASGGLFSTLLLPGLLVSSLPDLIGNRVGCFRPQCRSNARQFVSALVLREGSDAVLDCSDSRTQCLANAAHCNHSVTWHRYNGCGLGTKINFTQADARYEKSGYSIYLRNISQRESGVWACRFRALENNVLLTISPVFRIFQLVIEKGTLKGRSLCSNDNGERALCAPGQVCHFEKSGGSDTWKRKRCIDLNVLPLSEIDDLNRSDRPLCKMYSGISSCPVGTLTGAALRTNNSLSCCFCFTDQCQGPSTSLNVDKCRDIGIRVPTPPPEATSTGNLRRDDPLSDGAIISRPSKMLSSIFLPFVYLWR